MLFFGACLLFLPLLGLAQPVFEPVPAALPCRYGVIGLRAEAVAPETLQVRGVVAGGPAARAGLQPGDRLLACLPYRVRTPEELGRLVQSQAPGDTLSLLVERQGTLGIHPCAVTDRRHLFSFMGAQTGPAPSIRTAMPAPDPATAVETQLRSALEGQAALPVLDQFRAALAAEDTAYGADCRLRLIRRVFHQPLTALRELAALEQTAARPDLESLLEGAAAALDLPLPPTEFGGKPAGGDSLLAVLAPYFAAAEYLADALAPLEAGEQTALRAVAPALLQAMAANASPDLADSTQDALFRSGLGLAKRVRLGPLFQAARALAELASPGGLAALRRYADGPSHPVPAPAGIEGQMLVARATPDGWILVGGPGPNHYRGRLAVVIDLGGNDTYELATTSPVSAVIDFHGEDLYLGPAAAPVGGVALVVDLEGDDRYEGGWLGQGAAFCGVGILIDRQGRDHYQLAEFGQGAALFGAGFLLDEQGDDTYAATRHSQGFGGPRGFGLLRDRRGDDQYLADGQVPSSYGDIGLFEGWSQGVGCGLRGYAEGGIGFLLDAGGHDQYQGGNFAQGVGYFFGLGALVDRRGNDDYHGSRYAQGAAAHQALGALIDRAGDDRYLSRVAAGQGSAWDAAVAFLLDGAGNDRYRAGELSQGAGAMNGFGLLLDQRGRDDYEAASGQGASGSLEYWGGRQAPNLGVLLDAAGRDRYNLEGRHDRAQRHTPGLGLFEDR
ncbi:MAG: PDZ domain-containing protein [Candidatus Latescibacteria bacterium]|nr:PDZ domain-containing protein [Candidatus Latescibacterota bacterium]